MFKKIALGFSIILHPLLMPTIGIAILLNSGSFPFEIPYSTKKILIILIFSGTCLLPLLMMPLFYINRIISDVQLSVLKQRLLPISITLIFYLLTYLLMLRVPVYRFIHAFMLGSLIEVVVVLIISLKWKISIHMIALGGLTAFLFIFSFLHSINLFPYLIMSVLASGIAGSSRLILNVHRPVEVYVGYVTGVIVMISFLFLFY